MNMPPSYGVPSTGTGGGQRTILHHQDGVEWVVVTWPGDGRLDVRNILLVYDQSDTLRFVLLELSNVLQQLLDHHW